MLRARYFPLLVTLSLAVSLCLHLPLHVHAKQNRVLVGGFPRRGLDGPSTQLLQENFRLFTDYVSRRIGQEIILRPINDFSELRQKLSARELDFTWGWTAVESAEIWDDYPLKPFVTADPIGDEGGRLGYRYLLIMRSDNPYGGIGDIKGKTLFTLESEDGLFKNPSLVFVELLLKHAGKDAKAFFHQPPPEAIRTAPPYSVSMEYGQSKDLILKVLADPAAIASVREEAYLMLARRNPKIGQNLRVVTATEPFAIMPIFVWQDADRDLLKRIRSVLINMDKNPEGHEILQTVRIGAWRDASAETYDSLRKFLRDAARAGVALGL